MTSLNGLAFSSAIVEFVGVFLWIIEIYMDLLFLNMVDGRWKLWLDLNHWKNLQPPFDN